MTQDDYAGAFKRRFPLRPTELAALVVDMQYASGSRRHGLGAQLEAAGRPAAGRWRFDRIEDVVVPNLQRLLPALRRRGVPVVYVTLGSATGDFADVAPFLRDLARSTDNRAGSRSHEILDEISPEPDDAVVNKTTASAFIGSDLHRLLRARGVTQLLLTGISTNSCVESTGRDAADLGYECLVVEDCCSCASESLHRAALSNFDRLFGQITSTDALLADLA